MKHLEKFKKVFILFAIAICILLLSENKVQALNSAEAGNYIAQYAYNFMEKHGNETTYTYSQHGRSEAYYGRKVNGMYQVECTGFVSMVIHQSIGINDSGAANGSGSFVAPLRFYNYPGNYAPFYETNINSIQPGDILANSHHVMIYVGGGKIIHCYGHGDVYGGNGAIVYEDLSSYSAREDPPTKAFRLSDEEANTVNNADMGGDPHDLGGGFSGAIGGIWDKITGWVGKDLEEEDFEEFPTATRKPTDEETEKLYYKGIATKKGEKEINNDDSNWTFPSVSTVVDWVVGTLTWPIRGAFTGFAQIGQILISHYVDLASGETSNLKTDIGLLDDLRNQMANSLTVEKIVYNKVPLFDVNVFNLTQAGGKTISSSSLTAKIRELTANWYYVIRLVSIIGLLLVLIYGGIKAAISTIAQDKAKYKEMFVNWLVAFVIVFCMQYIMIAVMQINEALIGILSGIGKDLNIYESVRELTWHPQLTKGLIGMLLYITLVYYLFKFVIIYFRRLFVTVILIVIGPFVAAKYAFDKIKSGKGDSTLGKWVKEYIFSVMMQTTHALVYTIFVSTTINIAKASEEHIIATTLIALIFFNFMVKSEKILRNMLKLAASGGSEMGDVDSTDIKDLLGISLFWKRIIQPVRKHLLSPVSNYIGDKASNPNSLIGKVTNLAPVKAITNIPQNAYLWYRKNELEEMYGKGALYNGSGQTKSQMDAKLNEAIIEEYQMKKGIIKSAGRTAFKTGFGMVQAFVAIPVFVGESPLLGAEWMYTGIDTILTASGRPIKGYRVPENSGVFTSPSSKKVYSTMKLLATPFGMNFVLNNLKETYDQRLDIVNNQKPNQIKLILEARQAELALEQELSKLKTREFKGYQNESSSLEKNIAEINEEKLIENILDSQVTIPRAQIQEEIEMYKQETQKTKLDLNDVFNISKRCKDDERNIQITDNVQDNIRAEVKAELITKITGDKNNFNTVKIDRKSVNIITNNVKDIAKQLEDTEPEKKEAAELALYLLEYQNEKETENIENKEENRSVKSRAKDIIEEFKKNYNNAINIGTNEKIPNTDEVKQEDDTQESKDNKEKEIQTTKDILEQIRSGQKPQINTNNLPEEERKQVHEILQEAIDDSVINNTISKLDSDSLTETIKKSIDIEGSIEKAPVSERFKGVVEQAEKLRKINEQMEEITVRTMDKSADLKERESGVKLYEPGELLDLVRKGINSPNVEGK